MLFAESALNINTSKSELSCENGIAKTGVTSTCSRQGKGDDMRSQRPCNTHTWNTCILEMHKDVLDCAEVLIMDSNWASVFQAR